MSLPVPFTVAVEGTVDEAVARKLLESADARCHAVVGLRGKPWIDEHAHGLVKAGRSVPMLILRDLDRDGCVVEVRRRLDGRDARFACVRIAVHSIEAWLLADPEALAQALRVRRARIPSDPESIVDPKRCIVDLAVASTRREIRTELRPRRNSRASEGPGYNSFLADFVATAWSPERARLVSPSLDRACHAIERIVADYRAHIADGA